MEVVENGEFDWQSEEKKARERISQYYCYTKIKMNYIL